MKMFLLLLYLGEMRNTYKILSENLKELPLGKPRVDGRIR
jgi:hypothetical protein